MIKTLLIAASTVAMISAPIAASAQPYGHGGNNWRGSHSDSRSWNGGYDRGYQRHNDGAAIAAVGLMGLFLTAAIASNHSYDQPEPYAARCVWEQQPVRGPYGQWGYEPVQVCR